MSIAEAEHPAQAVSSDRSVPSNPPPSHYSPLVIGTRQGKDTPVECDRCLVDAGSAWLLGQSAQRYFCMTNSQQQEQKGAGAGRISGY